MTSKLKPKLPPLAQMAARNIDDAMRSIDATRGALEHVSGAASGDAQALLERAYRMLAQARENAIVALSK